MGVIEEIREGNKETIKNIYKENVKDVYNFAKSITGNHETALDATKKTFVILFNRIQKGETPANIRLSALKIAYDEACAIAMPSTDAIDSPYDKDKTDTEELKGFKVNENSSPAGAEAEDKTEDESGKEASEEEASDEEAASPEQAYEAEEKAPEEADESYEEVSEDDYAEDLSGEKPAEDYATGLFSEAEDEMKESAEDEPEEKPKKRRSVVSIVLLIIIIILVLILAWFILGLLQKLEVIPENINLGHQWFNEYIYPLF